MTGQKNGPQPENSGTLKIGDEVKIKLSHSFTIEKTADRFRFDLFCNGSYCMNGTLFEVICVYGNLIADGPVNMPALEWYRERAKLSDRVRPNSEAAPWVVEELLKMGE